MRRWAWLLLLTVACAGETERPVETTPASSGAAWLVDVTEEVGVDAQWSSGAVGEMAMPEIMGGGVALFDFDGDGDLDLLAANGAGANRLFENVDGRFQEVAGARGLDDDGYGMGFAVGDYDNDGDVDVYVANETVDRLYRNDDGQFVDVTGDVGPLADGWSASAVWCDYDNDGWLDLYVTQYVTHDPNKRCDDSAGRDSYCGPLEYPPLSDRLFHNEGGAALRDVTSAAGIDRVQAAGLGVVCDDFDGDGRADFYVANDAYGNQLWHNKGDGTFSDRAILLGAAFNVHGEPEAGMGVVAADFDNNATSDLFVTHLSLETNTYYANLGEGRGFSDATGEVGLAASSMALTGFGTAAFDWDLDGDLDLAVVNGRVNRTDAREDSWVEAPWSWFAEPNLIYLNEGAGRFRSVSDEAAAFVNAVEVSRSLAVGDWDLDGDDDLVVGNIESPLRLYRNEAPRSGNWLTLRAVDPALGGRDVIGARLFVAGQSRTVTRGYSYLTSGDAAQTFGVGSSAEVTVEVLWPDGTRESFTVPTNQRQTLVRGEGAS